MSKQTIVPPRNGILLIDENKWAIEPQKNMDDSYKHIAKWKKAIWKGYMILTIKHYAEGKIMETLKRWVIARVSPGVWDNE